jgi:hypothetical protein
MLLKDYLEGVDIFALIDSERTFSFLGNDTQTMTNMLKVYYGERVMFPAMETQTPQQAAEFIVLEYGDNWDALILQNALKETPEKLREIEETRGETKNTTNATTNTVSGFNSSTMVDDTGASGNEDSETEVTRLLTDKETSAAAVFEFLAKATQSSIIKTVQYNVATFLTLSIYEG